MITFQMIVLESMEAIKCVLLFIIYLELRKLNIKKIMFFLGQGQLAFDFKSRLVTDGINYFKPILCLFWHKFRKHRKRKDTIYGQWVCWNEYLIFFFKESLTPTADKNIQNISF